MAISYSGKIRLTSLFNSHEGLSYYRAEEIFITKPIVDGNGVVTKSGWTFDTTNQVYAYDILNIMDPIVLDVYDLETKKTVLADVNEILQEDGTTTIHITSISDNPIGLTIVHRTDNSDSEYEKDFYPTTKARLVQFEGGNHDGVSLQAMYENGMLNEYAAPIVAQKQYVYTATSAKFIEAGVDLDNKDNPKNGRVVAVIPGAEHELGDTFIVQSILKQQDNALVQDMNDVIIEIIKNKSTADVKLYFKSEFEGYIILKKTDLTN